MSTGKRKMDEELVASPSDESEEEKKFEATDEENARYIGTEDDGDDIEDKDEIEETEAPSPVKNRKPIPISVERVPKKAKATKEEDEDYYVHEEDKVYTVTSNDKKKIEEHVKSEGAGPVPQVIYSALSLLTQQLVLPKYEFSKHIDVWQAQVLPNIKDTIPKSTLKPVSCHLFGKGIGPPDLAPLVVVLAKGLPSAEEQVKWREDIKLLFPEDMRSGILVEFQQSALRRTVGSSTALPPVCEAKNPVYVKRPSHGASIGMKGYTDHTATLGGYIKVLGNTYAMTVRHIIPEAGYDDKTGLLHNERPFLTQASAQETLDPTTAEEFMELAKKMISCCRLCKEISEEVATWETKRWPGTSWDWDHESSILKELKNPESPQGRGFLEWSDRPGGDCLLAQMAISIRQHDEKRHRERIAAPFAELVISSGFTSCKTCTEGSHDVEMDWALFRPFADRLGTNNDDCKYYGWEEGPGWKDPLPESDVLSYGRTSGFQFGTINSSMSFVNFGDHETTEWAVVKERWQSGEAWVESGMGVDGDSGAWIFESESWMPIGMIWGRQGAGAKTVTYFTPMSEIVADIKRKMGDDEVIIPHKKYDIDYKILLHNFTNS